MSPLHNARSRDSSSIFSARKPRGVRRLRCSPLPSLPAGGSFRLDRYGKRSDTTGMNATVNSTNRNRANLLTVALPGSWPAAMARDVAPAPITSDGRAFFSPVCRAGGSAVMVGSTRRPATDPSSAWAPPVPRAGRRRWAPLPARRPPFSCPDWAPSAYRRMEANMDVTDGTPMTAPSFLPIPPLAAATKLEGRSAW